MKGGAISNSFRSIAAKRKDADERKRLLNGVDAVILCLPDDAAREAVALIENADVKVIDASTAYRVAPDWVYGFAEMAKDQRAKIAASKRISNPGCYPTGFIALVRPLVEAGVVPRDWPLSVNAVCGYSGGGKAMIAEFEDESSPAFTRVPYRIYAMTQEHKHVPEMQTLRGPRARADLRAERRALLQGHDRGSPAARCRRCLTRRSW